MTYSLAMAVSVFRTPEERFGDLPGFPYEPVYREAGGVRVAHVDVGEGAPVLMLHGSPAWSFIWRKLFPPLVDAGYRCIAPDHAGFGRSDKPLDPGWYSVERHVEITATLVEDLDLRDVTLVVHDWGGPIGLSLALTRPERIARIVMLDTAIDAEEVWMSETWVRFQDFILETEDLPIGDVLSGVSVHGLPDEVVAGYEAPFPSADSTVAFRGMYSAVPRAGDEEARAAAEAFYAALRGDSRPMLILWADSDLFLTLASGQRLASRIGRRIDHVIEDAGHALQEDQGPLIGKLIADWLDDLAT